MDIKVKHVEKYYRMELRCSNCNHKDTYYFYCECHTLEKVWQG